MARSTNKKERLVSAASVVAHTKGFSNMTLADVATKSGVPLGNVYYYFRSKEELGEALVEGLAAEYRAERERWERERDPGRRLSAWLQMVEGQRDILAESGCPVGSLCTEFAKTSPALRARAEVVFSELLDFAEAQFRELGLGLTSRAHALHLLSMLQGAAVVAHAFRDKSIVVREVATARRWLASVGRPSKPRGRRS